ncbi:DUF4131 domain-containing protein [Neobacillus notoginsengisoli]|uniref:DUF4131 domain-containing protein n=1 Tax=Neobacillus notoginsengisoli TaxID=1578198 RepID=UPI001314341E|nr:DUF4131 domain-containing protein [Neobacillus notoginsengisoli]
MVTAILIPLICLYFLWLTIREARENEEKWLDSGKAKEEAFLEGTITSILQEKQRFYYHRYLAVQELSIKSAGGTVQARIITPLTKDANLKDFRPGQTVRIYGSWQKNWFHANRVETTEQNK